MKKIFSYVLLFSAMGALTACSSDLDTATPSAESRSEITFMPEAPEVTVSSRAEQKTAWAETDKFNVIAYRDSADAFVTLYNNSEVNYVKAQKQWRANDIIVWPTTTNRIDFFAYYPNTLKSRVTYVTNGGKAPTMTYEMKSATVKSDGSFSYYQNDLLAAHYIHTKDSTKSVVPLKFQHMLTGIYFTVGDNCKSGTLMNISLTGVKTTGTFSFDSLKWVTSSLGTPVDQVWKFGDTGFAIDDIGNNTGKAGTEIIKKSDPILLLPQTLPEKATLKVTFTDALGTHNMERVLTGDQLKLIQGGLTEIKISISSLFVLNIEATLKDWSQGEIINTNGNTPTVSQ